MYLNSVDKHPLYHSSTWTHFEICRLVIQSAIVAVVKLSIAIVAVVQLSSTSFADFSSSQTPLPAITMAALCYTCRSDVTQVTQVFNMSLDRGDCPICMAETDELCVFVPCGHGICRDCAHEWATRLDRWVQVPGGPPAPTAAAAAERARERRWADTDSEDDDEVPPPVIVYPPRPAPRLLPEAVPVIAHMPRPAPWLLPGPVQVPVAPAAPAWAPLYGEVFQYQGRSVMWTQIWRFWNETVLVDSDTGRPSRDGHHLAFPPAIRGFHVTWHRASNSSNNKWLLCADVHDV